MGEGDWMNGNIGWTFWIINWLEEERIFKMLADVQWSLIRVELVRQDTLVYEGLDISKILDLGLINVLGFDIEWSLVSIVHIVSPLSALTSRGAGILTMSKVIIMIRFSKLVVITAEERSLHFMIISVLIIMSACIMVASHKLSILIASWMIILIVIFSREEGFRHLMIIAIMTIPIVSGVIIELVPVVMMLVSVVMILSGKEGTLHIMVVAVFI